MKSQATHTTAVNLLAAFAFQEPTISPATLAFAEEIARHEIAGNLPMAAVWEHHARSAGHGKHLIVAVCRAIRRLEAEAGSKAGAA